MTPTSWAPLISSIVGLIGVLIGVALTIYFNARTTRANLFSSYRLKWMDLFREELAQLLILGERLYEPSLQAEPPDVKLASDLRASGHRLIVLLGLEDELRRSFAKLVRSFAASPTASLASVLEREAQRVFRDAWDRGRADTGRPSRARRPPSHDQSPPVRIGSGKNNDPSGTIGEGGAVADG